VKAGQKAIAEPSLMYEIASSTWKEETDALQRYAAYNNVAGTASRAGNGVQELQRSQSKVQQQEDRGDMPMSLMQELANTLGNLDESGMNGMLLLLVL